jgi:tyrosine-protein kinase Etk/Wzc
MNQATNQYPSESSGDEINISALLDTLYLEKKLVIGIALVVALLGTTYALLSKPIYEADLSIQVEDNPSSAKSILGDVASMFDTKTAATAEIEILRSRMVVSQAVDNLGLHISARPKYLPVIGRWLASRSNTLSTPIMGGYVTGNEAIKVNTFNLPDTLQGMAFKLIADGKGGFELQQPQLNIRLKGKVGIASSFKTEHGDIELTVSRLEANAGAAFLLSRHSRLKTIEQLQGQLVIAEKGKSSGIIGIRLEGPDPVLTSQILNEVGYEYIRQNVHRKSEEAEKTLAFLDKQLPEIKRILEESEVKYNSLRDTRGTIDLGEEGKGLLQEGIGIDVKLVEFQQKYEDMLTRFTAQHPNAINAAKQIQILENQKAAIQAKIKTLPGLEQEVLRMVRDVKVNTELYTSLLNTAQQLNLLKASKIGTARLIDVAVIPEGPIKPKRMMIAAISVFLGLFLGIAVAFIRKAMRGGIDNPKIIEDATGLPVYATILESKQQEEFARQIKARQPGSFILAHTHPDDISVESLRSFRVALQFAMLDAPNNRVMITGASPGIGKTFIAANLAAILAQAGKRVLLLDMDLHKGHLNQYFGLPRTGGISELLAADKALGEVTHKNVLNNLDLITIGTRVSNPSSLFLTERLHTILEQMSSLYDVVLVDAPPVLLVSDVSVIGPSIGTTFLVVRDSVSTLADIHAAQKRLDQARVTVKGVLFNGQLQRISSHYGYGYGYGYKYSNYKKSGTDQS